jgi:hypothetical protein
MSETPWTPGPWFASDWSLDDGPNATTIESRKHTGSTWWPGGVEKIRIADTADGTNPLADARLIAAAPELAEALEKCLRDLEFAEEERAVKLESASAARAALAKAKGETP